MLVLVVFLIMVTGRPVSNGTSVFIDGGANCGNSYAYIMKMWPNLKDQRMHRLPMHVPRAHTNPALFRWILFEMNDEVYSKWLVPLQATLQKEGKSIQIVNKGLYIKNQSMTAYHSEYKSDKCGDLLHREEYPDGGGTLFPGVKKSNATEYKAQVFDFPHWLFHEAILGVDDFVVVKLDIEGTEMQIVPILLNSEQQLCSLVDVLFVEWHPDIANGGDISRLKAQLEQLSVACPKFKYFEWIA